METFVLKTKSYDGRYMELRCSQTPLVAENASRIDWVLSVLGGNSSWYSTGPTTVMIGQEQVYYIKRKSYSTQAFPAAKGSVSGTVTIPHQEDGSLTIPVSLTTAIYTQTLSTVEDNWQLDTIARKSLIRASDSRIGSCSTVVITRRSEAFRHQVRYQFGSRSGWLNGAGQTVSSPVTFGETTVNFLLPEVFYQEIPNDAYGTCRLTCITWYGSAEVGREECSFRVSADPAVCKPQVTGLVTAADDLTLSLTEGLLIPGVSVAKCAVTAAARLGAKLVSLTAGDVPVEKGEVLLPGWSLESVPVVAVDSRGFETRLSLPSPCLSYVQLTLQAEAQRPEPTADRAILTLTGACYGGSFGKKTNSLTATVEVNGQQTVLPLEILSDGYGVSLELPELPYTRSYPVTVTVQDLAMTVTRQVTVRKGLPVFDWGDGDFCFHVPVDLPALTIAGVPLADYIRQQTGK